MAKKKTNRRDNNTGSIYQEGDGYRVAVLVGYDDRTGKAKYKKARAANHKEAVATLDRLQADLRSGHLIDTKSPTFADYFNAWLEHKVKALRAPSTYRQYEWVVREHLIPALGKKKLDQVSRVDVKALIARKMAQTTKPRASNPTGPNEKVLSRSTLGAMRVVLHSAYQDAIKDGLAARNPADDIELPKVPSTASIFLSPEQAARLLKQAQQSDIPELLAFLLTTGTRIGEALGIRWQDFDLVGRRVTVCGQLQRVNSKLIRLNATKTNQNRTLPLSTSLVDALRDMQSKQLIEGWSDPEGIAFLNAFGRRFDTKFVTGRIKAVCKAANVPEVSPHKLRHTAATIALAETGDLHAVQKLLGHQTVALTANLYGHATAETLRPLSDALERALRTDSA